MAFSIGSDGWAIVTPSGTWHNGYSAATASGTSNVIYVANSGNDSTGDGSSGTPYQTLAFAFGKLRNGSPDWVLAKKGDLFTDDIPGVVALNGKSATERMVFASYSPTGIDVNNPRGTGTGARPKLDVSAITMNTSGKTYCLGWGGNGNYWFVAGIEGHCYDRDPNDVRFSTTARDIAFSGSIYTPVTFIGWTAAMDSNYCEDIKGTYFTGIWGGNATGTKFTNAILSRSFAAHTYGSGSDGIFLDGVGAGCAVLESWVWKNDSDDAAAAVAPAQWKVKKGVDTLFAHGLYANDDPNTSDPFNQPLLSVGNAFGGGSFGTHQRIGVFEDDNLYFWQVTAGDQGRPYTGVDYYSVNTVCTDFQEAIYDTTNNSGLTYTNVPNGQAHTCDASDSLGMAIDAGTIRYQNNLYSYYTGTIATGFNGAAVIVSGTHGLVTVTGNVAISFGWSPADSAAHGSFIANAGANASISGNKEVNFAQDRTTPSPYNTNTLADFSDPTRTIARYCSEVLGISGVTDSQSLGDYILNNQSRDNWDSRLMPKAINDWLRGGADLSYNASLAPYTPSYYRSQAHHGGKGLRNF